MQVSQFGNFVGLFLDVIAVFMVLAYVHPCQKCHDEDRNIGIESVCLILRICAVYMRTQRNLYDFVLYVYIYIYASDWLDCYAAK